MKIVDHATTVLAAREPFSSVGLVCTCGTAVAGIEGVLSPCKGCGKVYLVSVMVVLTAGEQQ